MNELRDNKDLDGAFAMADHGLTLCDAKHGRRHIETGRWVGVLGGLLLLRENCSQAIHCFIEAFDTFTR
jgi:hypothetical protein